MSPGPALQPRVAIALCGNLGAAGGLDVALLVRELELLEPDAHVDVVEDLCHEPVQAADVVPRSAADRLVLGMCAASEAAHDFQARARAVGLDPFALEFVELGGVPDQDTAARIVAAAVARQRASSGSRPEQQKLRLLSFAHKRSRRSLLTVPPSTYEPVASVDRGRCVGEERCGLCATACPFAAIRMAGGKAAVDRDSCSSCGICVTACPVGAIDLPGASLPQHEAALSVLLEAPVPRIVFTCRGALGGTTGSLPLAAGWLPIEVPCLGMVTPAWILQALSGGAASVALLACGDACRSDRATQLGERVDYCREVLELLGESSPAERVVLGRSPEEAGAWARAPRGRTRQGPVMLLEPAGTAKALFELRESYGAPSRLSLFHPGSPLGLVALRDETCTACGACSASCPTGALALKETANATTISYDPALCVSCGRCVPVCPEAAHDTLTLRAGTDLAALESGRMTLKQARSARCHRCGRPVAPDAMLGRIRSLLEGDEASGPLIAILTQFCSDCRALESTPSAEHVGSEPTLDRGGPGLGN